jgi:hypothetical protein
MRFLPWFPTGTAHPRSGSVPVGAADVTAATAAGAPNPFSEGGDSQDLYVVGAACMGEGCRLEKLRCGFNIWV